MRVRQFGERLKYAVAISALAIVVDRALIEQKKIDRAAFDDEAKRLLLAEPGIQTVYARSELESGARAGAPYFDSIRKGWDRERSGDLQFALKPWWMMSSSNAATQGSPHSYDSNVPILLYGPRWIAAGRNDTPVEVVDIAPTLARLLGVAAPPGFGREAAAVAQSGELMAPKRRRILAPAYR